MDYAIEVLQQAVKQIKSNLYRMDKAKARDLETATEWDAAAAGAPDVRIESQYVNAATGCRNSAAWIENVATPTERRKLTELEEALAVLQNRERPVVRVTEPEGATA